MHIITGMAVQFVRLDNKYLFGDIIHVYPQINSCDVEVYDPVNETTQIYFIKTEDIIDIISKED